MGKVLPVVIVDRELRGNDWRDQKRIAEHPFRVHGKDLGSSGNSQNMGRTRPMPVRRMVSALL